MVSQADGKRRSRVWIVVVAVVLLLFLIPAAIFYQRTKDIDEWTRDWVVRSLSEHFASRVELGSMHVSAFPEMSATGENLTIYYHNRTDVPPLIHIQQFTFHLGFMGILRVPRHIRGVHIDDMVITIPPRGRRNRRPAGFLAASHKETEAAAQNRDRSDRVRRNDPADAAQASRQRRRSISTFTI